MSRPLRIAYPGAWYHIMNRGRRSEKIFLDKTDYTAFVSLLKDTTDAWNICISAYCLMPNHYHMLIHTPEGNISRAMRHINGVYTQRFNSRHYCDGQLFRGRYKSILVGGDSYLLQLVRYIHHNPLKACIVDNLNAYTWSSHKAYLSIAKKWDWLHKSFILNVLTGEKKKQINAYRKFMVDADDNLSGIIDQKRWPSLLGPKTFIDWVKASYRALQDQSEIRQTKDLTIDRGTILSNVRLFYKVNHDELLSTKRGHFNEPRSAAIYLMRRLRRDSLSEIGLVFHVEKYSTISSTVERLKYRMKQDPKQKKRIMDLENCIYKSQGQT